MKRLLIAAAVLTATAAHAADFQVPTDRSEKLGLGIGMMLTFHANCEKLPESSLKEMGDLHNTGKTTKEAVTAGVEKAIAEYKTLGPITYCATFKRSLENQATENKATTAQAEHPLCRYSGDIARADNEAHRDIIRKRAAECEKFRRQEDIEIQQQAAIEARQAEQARQAEKALATNLQKTLEITFVRGAQSGGIYTGVVAMRNTTGIDFGTVAWACEFREGGYKTGGGYAVFHVVLNNVIAVDSLSFHQNGTAQFTAKCELASTEKLTTENARLHSFGRQRANVPLSASRFWQDGYNNGSAVVTD